MKKVYSLKDIDELQRKGGLDGIPTDAIITPSARDRLKEFKMSDTEKPAPAKGLEGVVAATTKLSSVRGLDGELIYRGYNINELAGNATYEEVVHLLHRGKLPNQAELDSLKAELAAARELPGGVVDIIRQLPKEASPMRAIRTLVSALACYEPPEGQDSMEVQAKRAIKLIAQVPVITAYFHLARQGKPLPDSDPSLGEAANFLYLIDGEKPIEEKEKTIDMCYILHADHGMNASTFSARVTIATLSGMYSAITSAIGTPFKSSATNRFTMLSMYGSELPARRSMETAPYTPAAFTAARALATLAGLASSPCTRNRLFGRSASVSFPSPQPR